MFETYFGEVKTGQLRRLAYLGYSILLSIIVIAIILGAIIFLGGTEKLFSGDLEQTQDYLIRNYGLPAMIAFALFMMVVAFAHTNIMAKRFRDIGLPGWWTVLAVIVVSAVSGVAFQNIDPAQPNTISAIIDFVVLVVLLFVPGKLFNK